MLTAREFNRGTMQMLDGLRPYERLGMRIPNVQIVINCLDQTNDSRAIHENVRAIFDEHQDISVLENDCPGCRRVSQRSIARATSAPPRNAATLKSHISARAGNHPQPGHRGLSRVD